MLEGRHSSLISVLVKVVGNVISGLGFFYVNYRETRVDSGCIPSVGAFFVLSFSNGGPAVALWLLYRKGSGKVLWFRGRGSRHVPWSCICLPEVCMVTAQCFPGIVSLTSYAREDMPDVPFKKRNKNRVEPHVRIRGSSLTFHMERCMFKTTAFILFCWKVFIFFWVEWFENPQVRAVAFFPGG